MTNKEYIDAHAACGLKVGDTVRVVRKAKSDENGWDNDWIAEMDAFVGLTGVICKDSKGTGFELDETGYKFPFFVLEKVSDKAPDVERIGPYGVTYNPNGKSIQVGCTPVYFSQVKSIYEHMLKLQEEQPKTMLLHERMKEIRPTNLTNAEAAIYDKAVAKMESDSEYRNMLRLDSMDSSECALEGLFDWSKSDEGEDFWDAIYTYRM